MPFVERKLMIPFYYFPIYLYVFYNYFKILFSFQTFKVKKCFLYLIFILSLSILINIYNINYFTDSLIYLFMWIINILVANYILNYDKNYFLLKSVSIAGYLIIISFMFSLFFNFNPLLFFNSYGMNVNQISFLFFSVFIYSSFFKKSKILFLISTLPVFILKSRMLIIQFAYILFFRSRFTKVILVFCFLLLIITFIKLDLNLLFTEIYYIFLKNETVLVSNFSDSRRLSLLYVSFEIVSNLFPFGTGLGLKNYTYYSNYFGFEFPSFRGGLAHNFYITYLGKMGILFFPFLYFLIIPVYKIGRPFKYIGYALLLGILFNEYITSPFFWITYSTCLSKYKSVI